MSGNLFNEAGRFTRGEDETGSYSFFDTPYAPLIRALFFTRPLLEPAFELDGTGAAGYVVGAQGGLKFDVILAKITPASGGQVVRLATRFFTNRGIDESTEAGKTYDGRLMEVKVGKTCINALTAGSVVGIALSELTIYNDDRRYDFITNTAEYIGQPVELYGIRHHDTSPWINSQSQGHLIFTGTVQGIARLGKRITLTLGDATNFGSKKLTEQKYDGATNNGGTSLKDQPKPVCVGSVFNITPVYLGQVNLGAGTLPTYQVNYTGISDVTAVRVRGAAMAKITSGTPAVGQYRPFNSVGQFQVGSTPSGALTCDVDGHNQGTYTFSNTVENVLRKLIVDVSGALGSSLLPAGNFSAVISMNATAGVYIGPQKATLTEALNTVCDGTLVVLHGLRNGEVGAFMIDVPTPPVFSITDIDVMNYSASPLPDSLLPLPDDIELSYEFNHTKLSDIADTITGDLRTYLGQESRKLTIPTAYKGMAPRPRTLKFVTLFRDLASATTRGNLYKEFLNKGPRIVDVVTPYYLGQVELGMTASVTLQQLGISGRQMVVVEFQEDFVAGTLQLRLIG